MSFISDKLAWRQKEALNQASRALKGLTSGGGKSITAVLLIVVQALGCVFFDLPMTPSGQNLDLTGYELVFEDEFEGESLDMDKWEHRGDGRKVGDEGYFADTQVWVEDGNMILRGEWLDEGKYGPGWYAGMVKLTENYKYGYYEMRCIANDDDQFWSAFWLQSNYSYTPEISQGGVGGAEIDVFESFNYNKGRLRKNAVHQTIHCAGVDGDYENSRDIDSQSLGQYYGNNIFEEYNTYGLEWDENEYIFYINGVETVRSSYGLGTSQVVEEVIASINLPSQISHDKDFKTDMIVDYVRIYQKP